MNSPGRPSTTSPILGARLRAGRRRAGPFFLRSARETDHTVRNPSQRRQGRRSWCPR
jgi:hypothetical protein